MICPLVFFLLCHTFSNGIKPEEDEDLEDLMARSLLMERRLTFTKNSYFFLITLPTFLISISLLGLLLIATHMPNCCFGLFVEPKRKSIITPADFSKPLEKPALEESPKVGEGDVIIEEPTTEQLEKGGTEQIGDFVSQPTEPPVVKCETTFDAIHEFNQFETREFKPLDIPLGGFEFTTPTDYNEMDLYSVPSFIPGTVETVEYKPDLPSGIYDFNVCSDIQSMSSIQFLSRLVIDAEVEAAKKLLAEKKLTEKEQKEERIEVRVEVPESVPGPSSRKVSIKDEVMVINPELKELSTEQLPQERKYSQEQPVNESSKETIKTDDKVLDTIPKEEEVKLETKSTLSLQPTEKVLSQKDLIESPKVEPPTETEIVKTEEDQPKSISKEEVEKVKDKSVITLKGSVQGVDSKVDVTKEKDQLPENETIAKDTASKKDISDQFEPIEKTSSIKVIEKPKDTSKELVDLAHSSEPKQEILEKSADPNETSKEVPKESSKPDNETITEPKPSSPVDQAQGSEQKQEVLEKSAEQNETNKEVPKESSKLDNETITEPKPPLPVDLTQSSEPKQEVLEKSADQNEINKDGSKESSKPDNETITDPKLSPGTDKPNL